MGIAKDWRSGEKEEFAAAGKSSTAYASFIRQVISEKGPNGNWAGKPENNDTYKAIADARQEMADKGIKGDVANYMAKEMTNFDRTSRGMEALPDPQTAINRAGGAWQQPAQQAPAMEAPAGPIAGRTFFRDAPAVSAPGQ